MRTGFANVDRAIRHANPGRLRIYTLIPIGFGRFSTKGADYCGTEWSVAATSIRQAYAVAHKGVWINPLHPRPIGIVTKYTRAAGFRLWCGCGGHDVTGGQVDHGEGIRALREAIAEHRCVRTQP